MTARSGEASFGGLPEERILQQLEKLDERLRSVEKELAGLKVWGGILSVLLPSLLVVLLAQGVIR